MIPDIAIMLAIYMIARMLRSCIGPQTYDAEGKSEGFYLPTLFDILAMLAVGFLAWHVYSLGAQTTAEMQRLHATVPGFTP